MLTIDDLVRGDNCFFAATGITDGALLDGVRFDARGVTTQSLVMRTAAAPSAASTPITSSPSCSEFADVDYVLWRGTQLRGTMPLPTRAASGGVMPVTQLALL